MVSSSDLISKGYFPEQLIPPFNAKKLVFFNDCIVPLISLDLDRIGLLKGPYDTSFIEEFMTRDCLYNEHWLLAYEALKKNWLPSVDGVDYLDQDPFFSILKNNDVEFYDSDLSVSKIPIEPTISPY